MSEKKPSALSSQHFAEAYARPEVNSTRPARLRGSISQGFLRPDVFIKRRRGDSRTLKLPKRRLNAHEDLFSFSCARVAKIHSPSTVIPATAAKSFENSMGSFAVAGICFVPLEQQIPYFANSDSRIPDDLAANWGMTGHDSDPVSESGIHLLRIMRLESTLHYKVLLVV